MALQVHLEYDCDGENPSEHGRWCGHSLCGARPTQNAAVSLADENITELAQLPRLICLRCIRRAFGKQAVDEYRKRGDFIVNGR